MCISQLRSSFHAYIWLTSMPCRSVWMCICALLTLSVYLWNKCILIKGKWWWQQILNSAFLQLLENMIHNETANMYVLVPLSTPMFLELMGCFPLTAFIEDCCELKTVLFPWFFFYAFASTVVMLWISCSWECALLLRGQQLWPSCAAIAPQLYSHKDRCLPFTPQCLCLRVKQSRAVKMLSGFSRLSGTPVPCSGLQPCLQTHWLLVLGAAVELCSHSCECCRDDDVWL